jgi:hypothetical protein
MSAFGYIDMSALPLFFRLTILTLLRESYAGFGLHLPQKSSASVTFWPKQKHCALAENTF